MPPTGYRWKGRPQISRIVTGVTASQALLDAAVAHNADAVLVHHGYFWKNESPVVAGMKHRRLKTLLGHDINLFAWHLPLDAHPVLGNNAQLAALMDIKVQGLLEPLLPWGSFAMAVSPQELQRRLEMRLERDVLHCGDNAPSQIRRLAWCTGGGQGFIEPACPCRGGCLYHRRGLRTDHSTLPARPGFIFTPPAIMPLNAAASGRWGSGWRGNTIST